MIEIRPLNFMDLAYVAMNMREWDRREIFATAITDNPVDFAKIIANWGGPGWVAYKDLEPVVAFGAAPLWKGVCSVWAFGTDRFPEVGLSVTRFMRKTMAPMLIEMGVHRAECKSMEGHTEAHAWLESLGLSREAEHPGYGSNGETFYTYARLHRAEQTDEVKEAA
jgi:hypothetical protein